MTEKVRIIEDFNTTMGHLLLVDNDRSFQVGQTIDTGIAAYLVRGIQPHRDPEQHKVVLRVEKIQ